MINCAQIWLKRVMVVLPLLLLWVQLIRQLSIQWNLNPQYTYGWAVPFLCIYLIWGRTQRSRSENQESSPKSSASARRQQADAAATNWWRLCASWWSFAAFILCAFLYAPTRLVQEANPGWSLVSWPLALEVIGLTLLFIHFVVSHPLLEHPLASSHSAPSSFILHRLPFSAFCFPLLFFLVAVPWPSFVGNPIIQGLTRLNVGFMIEIMGWFGIPAIQHGNVVELATSSVGVDEACSGIRSLQATLMLTLFFGELYRLTVPCRVLCVVTGFAIAMACNLGRMLLLTWVAARRGEQAIAGWHDPAGVTILLACFVGVWLFAVRQSIRHRPKMVADKLTLVPHPAPPAPSNSEFRLRTSDFASGPSVTHATPRASRVSLLTLSSALAIWLVLVEVGVAAWYLHIESRVNNFEAWRIAWPEDRQAFRELAIPDRIRQTLRYDEARQVQWIEPDDSCWQVSWFRWKPGQAAGYLAKSHNPLVCMPAAGYGVISTSPPQQVNLKGLCFPYRIYSFERGGITVHVLYSRWDDQAAEQSFASEGNAWSNVRLNLLRSIWTGQGNRGQQVVTMAVWSAPVSEDAQTLLLQQLSRLLIVESDSNR